MILELGYSEYLWYEPLDETHMITQKIEKKVFKIKEKCNFLTLPKW